MVVAVDFDGTLFEDNFPYSEKPLWNVINYCKKLKSNGDVLILWTCRSGKDLLDAIEKCRQVGLSFDFINENDPNHILKYNNDSRKIYADVYIDDKSFNPVQISS